VDPASKPHNRKYTLRCLLTTPKEKISDVLSHLKDLRIVSEGEGSSKKAAKQCACQKVLDRLREITGLTLCGIFI
jgi:dsRNA-specific ribonuclease